VPFKLNSKKSGAYKKSSKRPSKNVYNEETESASGKAKRKKPQSKASNVITTILVIIAVGVFAFSSYNLIQIYLENKAATDEYDGIFQDAVELDPASQYLRINYSKLKEKNPDFVAWIHIPGTNVSYPVVYKNDGTNLSYLRHTFEKQYNTAGTVFIDYRSDPTLFAKNTIIYGHKMNNGTMFADVAKYATSESFWNEHREVHLYTELGITIYQVFSAYKANIEDECYTFNFVDDEHFSSWIRYVKGQSNYPSTVNSEDISRVILLSTCVSGSDADENYRFVTLASFKQTIPNVDNMV